MGVFDTGGVGGLDIGLGISDQVGLMKIDVEIFDSLEN